VEEAYFRRLAPSSSDESGSFDPITISNHPRCPPLLLASCSGSGLTSRVGDTLFIDMSSACSLFADRRFRFGGASVAESTAVDVAGEVFLRRRG